MALTRNDKLLILCAVILAALVVGGLAWWRTSGSLPPVHGSGQSQDLPADRKVEAPKDAKPAVSAPIGEAEALKAPAQSPAAPGPIAPATPATPAPVGPEPDKTLAAIFSEKPASAPEPAPAPAPVAKAPETQPAEPAPAPEKKKPETPAERRARIAAEKRAQAEAKQAEAEAKKARAETLRRAQEELRKAEAELKAAQAKLKKEQETKAKQAQEASARQGKQEPAPEANSSSPAAPAPQQAPAAKDTPAAPPAAPVRHVVDRLTVTDAGSDIVVSLPGASTKDKPEALILTTPPRLVIDLPGQWAYQVTGNPSPQMVKALRVGKHADKLRLVLDLAVTPKGPKRPAVEKTAEGLVVRIAK